MKRKAHYLEYDISGYSALIEISLERALGQVSSEQMMASLIKSLISGYISKGNEGVLRIKAFLKCPSGYVRADSIGLRGKIFIDSTIRGSVKEAKLAINVVGQGLSGEELKIVAMKAVEKTLSPLNGAFSIIKEHVTI